MKYVCLVYQDAKRLAEEPDRTLDGIVAESLSWIEELEETRRYVFSSGLQSSRTSAILRVKEGALSVQDSPVAEAREYLSGFTVFEAKDLNEAIQICASLPACRLGSVEVRPLLDPLGELSDPLDRRIAVSILKTSPVYR